MRGKPDLKIIYSNQEGSKLGDGPTPLDEALAKKAAPILVLLSDLSGCDDRIQKEVGAGIPATWLYAGVLTLRMETGMEKRCHRSNPLQ